MTSRKCSLEKAEKGSLQTFKKDDGRAGRGGMPVIPALGRPRQKGGKFELGLGYIKVFFLDWCVGGTEVADGR